MEKRILQPGQKIIYYRLNSMGETPICKFDNEYETKLLKIRGGENLINQIRYEHPFAIMMKEESDIKSKGILSYFDLKKQYQSILIPKEKIGDIISANLFTKYEKKGNKVVLLGGRVSNFAIEFVGIDLERILREGFNRGINNKETGSRLFPRSKSE